MRASGKTAKTFIWILMGLLILGLGGFGVTNLGGSVRSIGTVGDKDITTQSYFNALQQMLRSQSSTTGSPLSFAEAQARQLDRIVLSQLVATRALDHETAQLGLSVGDARLAQQIVQTEAFHGVTGAFNREDYRFRLQQIGLTESAYEEILREEMARTLVQSAMFSAVSPPKTYADTIVNFIAEQRDFTWVLLDEPALDTPLPAASEADLASYHKANAARYMSPALRKITYAQLTPEQMIPEVDVDESTLQQLFEERAAEQNRPERRLVERLIFADQAEAEAAHAALSAGETTFDALVSARGLTGADVDMGDVSLAELEGAGAVIFAAATGDIVGPEPTDLGPALFQINGVLAPVTLAYEDLRDELRDEFAQGRARRLIDRERERFEDLLAAGATLEELAAETLMTLGQIDWHSAAEEGPAGYLAFQEAAASVTKEDFPEIIELEDGGLIALRLDAEVPAAEQPLSEVRATVVADERNTRLTEALIAKADALKKQLESGADFAELTAGLELRAEQGRTRGAFLADAPATLMVDVFGLKTPSSTVVSATGPTVALARLDSITPADLEDPEVASTRTMLQEQYRNDLAQDIYTMFISDIQSRTPVTLDDAAINAVHTQFQ